MSEISSSRVRAIFLIVAVVLGLATVGLVYMFDSQFTGESNGGKNDVLSVTGELYGETDDSPSTRDAGPLFFATMTHMEGSLTDDVNEVMFLKHVDALRFAMDLADEYKASLTIESEKPFARANVNWGVNIMKEILDRGHGVGTHCDIGFNKTATSVTAFAAEFKENKSLVDALVGATNNVGCSGGGSSVDWVLAASQAGFKYIDGVVGMHYLAMDISNRPSGSWTDAFIRKDGYHYAAPFNLADRISVFGLADATDFNEDTDWKIAVLAGELGALQNMSEGDAEKCTRICPLTNADIDALVQQIHEAVTLRDSSHVSKLDVYLTVNLFTPENEDVLRYFFSEVEKLADQGVITWATQKEIYEAFVAFQE
ncbi:MAG: hypothetical protein AAB448_02375 [Patescibacteria group bacterium]